MLDREVEISDARRQGCEAKIQVKSGARTMKAGWLMKVTRDESHVGVAQKMLKNWLCAFVVFEYLR